MVEQVNPKDIKDNLSVANEIKSGLDDYLKNRKQLFSKFDKVIKDLDDLEKTMKGAHDAAFDRVRYHQSLADELKQMEAKPDKFKPEAIAADEKRIPIFIKVVEKNEKKKFDDAFKAYSEVLKQLKDLVA